MALFGKPDLGLPVLTHVLQLDTQNLPEMFKFCEIYVDRQMLEYREVEEKRPHLKDRHDRLEVFMRKRQENAKQRVREMQIVCFVAQELFSHIVKENRIYETDVSGMQEINKTYQNYQSLHAIDTDAKGEIEFKEDGWVPITNIVFEERGIDFGIPAEIFMQVKTILLTGRDLLKVCEECNNVYQRDDRRYDQKYCSLRCGGRARDRRQRQRKKETEKHLLTADA